MSQVWGLVDDRVGHRGQVLGVIAKLGQMYQLKSLEYNRFGELPSVLQGASLLGVDSESRRRIAAPWPTLVIAAGRRTIPTLRYIKKQSPSTITVYLMAPDSYRDIDLVAAPEHDAPAEAPNVMRTLGPLHAITAETLHAARQTWELKFKHLPKPWLGVCLGGDTKHGSYSMQEWRNLLSRAQSLAPTGSLLVTTSRRTPGEVVSLYEPLLQGNNLFFRFHNDKDNPYLGILACADALIVTGDSMSMCAESAVSGKPLFIAATPRVLAPKYLRFHQSLYERGLAKQLDAESVINWAPNAPLDDAGKVAYEIRARFPQALL